VTLALFQGVHRQAGEIAEVPRKNYAGVAYREALPCQHLNDRADLAGLAQARQPVGELLNGGLKQAGRPEEKSVSQPREHDKRCHEQAGDRQARYQHARRCVRKSFEGQPGHGGHRDGEQEDRNTHKATGHHHPAVEDVVLNERVSHGQGNEKAAEGNQRCTTRAEVSKVIAVATAVPTGTTPNPQSADRSTLRSSGLPQKKRTIIETASSRSEPEMPTLKATRGMRASLPKKGEQTVQAVPPTASAMARERQGRRRAARRAGGAGKLMRPMLGYHVADDRPLNTSMNVLIVDDQRSTRRTMASLLHSLEGLVCFEADSLESARRVLAEHAIDVALIDLRLGTDPRNRDGLTLVREITETTTAFPMVVTGSSEMAEIRTAMRYGAYDYILKDDLCEELLVPIVQGLQTRRRLEREVTHLRARCAVSPQPQGILGGAIPESLIESQPANCATSSTVLRFLPMRIW
jgi:CheY-like chemotaxis protein